MCGALKSMGCRLAILSSHGVKQIGERCKRELGIDYVMTPQWLHNGIPWKSMEFHRFLGIFLIFLGIFGIFGQILGFWPRGGRNRVDASEICRNQSLFCQTEPSGPSTPHF